MSASTAPQPLITPERLQREGIPPDAQVRLRTQGTRISYGVIPPAHLFGHEPTLDVFRGIACQGQDWHAAHQVDLHFSHPQKSKKLTRLQIPLTPPLSPPEIIERSLGEPIAVWARSEADMALREGRPFTLAELLTLTCVGGELHLGDTILFGAAQHVIHRYHAVVYCGRDMRLDEFSWLPSRAPNALSILQDMAQHTGVTDPHRAVIEAYWNAPDELAEFLRAFIRRFGLAHAKALLGETLLQAIHERRLREELDPRAQIGPGQALIAFPEAASAHGQLEFHEPDEPVSVE